MKKKIVGIFICMLFVFSGLASATINLEKNVEPKNEPQAFNIYFYIAKMERVDPEVYNFDFVILSFAFIIGNGEINRLNEGEMIRLEAPIFGIIFNNFHIGIASDWSIIG